MAPTEGIPTVVSEFPAETTQKIVAQVKHYFSDANLNQDAYMRKTVSENDGWMTMLSLSRFNRLRQLMDLPHDSKKGAPKGSKKRALPPVPEHIVRLLGASLKNALTEADDVEMKEDASAIRRKSAFEASDDWFGRTVHFKGLKYGSEPADLIDDLTRFFNGAIEGDDIELLRLRRNPKTKHFKGNVLVQFKTVEQAEAASKRDDLEFAGEKLEPMMLPAYHDEKLAANEFLQNELRKPGGSYPTFEEWCEANGRKLPSATGEKRKPDAEADAEPAAEEEQGEEETPDVQTLVRFSGVVGEPQFRELKEALNGVGPVRYVEFEKGDDSGIVRFKEPVADRVIEENPEGFKVTEEMTLTFATVDEETAAAFYARAKSASNNARANGSSRGGKRGGFRGGYRGKRSRK
ncbi:hypothetical protein IWW50_000053 [Coemansia erecta]|nr:hypothetical protein GGF43_000174 [Coemansia sp. RSA 2618]KAJ2830832.1 hypothetical protein IWW50_000053 [Coemansia erecta]